MLSMLLKKTANKTKSLTSGLSRIWIVLKSMKHEIIAFVLFILIRLPNLGNDFFNTDVWRWKARIYDFGSGVFGFDFAQTIQKYHPGVILMWLGAAAVKFYNLFYDIFVGSPPRDDAISTVFELHFAQKFFIVLAIGAALSFVFCALRKRFGVKYAWIVFALLMLDPFYAGLTRAVHLEGLMSTFMLASFTVIPYSAFFAGLAILTKTSALFLLPFTGIILFLKFWSRKWEFGSSLKTALHIYWKWLLIIVLVFVAFWPAMWVTPIKALETLYKGIFTIGVEKGHQHIYFGYSVNDPGFSFYPVVLAFKTSIYCLD